MKPINYSAFSIDVSFGQLTKYVMAKMKTNIFFILLLSFMSIFILFVFWAISSNFRTYGVGVFMLVPLVFMLLAIIAIIYSMFSRGLSSIKLQQFAADNNYRYSEGFYPFVTSRKGLIFEVGYGRKYDNAIEGSNYSVGNYSYSTGNDKNKSIRRAGIIAIKLGRELPHIVFDNKKNNFMSSNLPVSFDSRQIVSLEGDFDKYFTTYIPDGYVIDVLSYVTPELMQALKTEAAMFDVEIVGDEIFLYKDGAIIYDKELESMLQSVAVLVKEFVENTKYYSDSRVDTATNAIGVKMPTTAVAPESQILRRSKIGWIFGFSGVGMYFLMQLVFKVSSQNTSGNVGNGKVATSSLGVFAPFGIITAMMLASTIYRLYKNYKK